MSAWDRPSDARAPHRLVYPRGSRRGAGSRLCGRADRPRQAASGVRHFQRRLLARSEDSHHRHRRVRPDRSPRGANRDRRPHRSVAAGRKRARRLVVRLAAAAEAAHRYRVRGEDRRAARAAAGGGQGRQAEHRRRPTPLRHRLAGAAHRRSSSGGRTRQLRLTLEDRRRCRHCQRPRRDPREARGRSPRRSQRQADRRRACRPLAAQDRRRHHARRGSRRHGRGADAAARPAGNLPEALGAGRSAGRHGGTDGQSRRRGDGERHPALAAGRQRHQLPVRARGRPRRRSPPGCRVEGPQPEGRRQAHGWHPRTGQGRGAEARDARPATAATRHGHARRERGRCYGRQDHGAILRRLAATRTHPGRRRLCAVDRQRRGACHRRPAQPRAAFGDGRPRAHGQGSGPAQCGDRQGQSHCELAGPRRRFRHAGRPLRPGRRTEPRGQRHADRRRRLDDARCQARQRQRHAHRLGSRPRAGRHARSRARSAAPRRLPRRRGRRSDRQRHRGLRRSRDIAEAQGRNAGRHLSGPRSGDRLAAPRPRHDRVSVCRWQARRYDAGRRRGAEPAPDLERPLRA